MPRVREERRWAWTSDAPDCVHQLWGQLPLAVRSCGSEWFCTRCKGKQLEEVTKLIYKAWLGSVNNGEEDTDDFWTSLSQSEALEAVLVNGEGSDAMKDSSVSEESIEAMEEWLKKN